jgi:hypothetical protein
MKSLPAPSTNAAASVGSAKTAISATITAGYISSLPTVSESVLVHWRYADLTFQG